MQYAAGMVSDNLPEDEAMIRKTLILTAVLWATVPTVANADVITYDIFWTGSLGNTMTGVFTYDSASAVDGLVRDRDNDLLSLEIASAFYGLSWTWSGDPTDPFNFNFVLAGLEFPVNGAVGSIEAQSWNGEGVGLGLGLEGTGGRSGLLVNGSFVEGTSSLTSTVRETAVPEPSTLALLGIGLIGMGLARHRKQI